MKHYFVYKSTNILTDDFYIGKHETSNLHDGYLGSGKRLLNSVAKYGAENFKRDILSFHSTADEAFAVERVIIGPLLAHPKCLNLVDGGRGFTSVSGKRASDIAILTGRFGAKYKTPEGKRRSSAASAKSNKLKGTGMWGMTFEQRSKWSRESATGRIWITDGRKDRHVFPKSAIPDGWYKGRCTPGSQYRIGMQCWNNSKVNIFSNDKPGPDFVQGMVKETPTAFMPWWNNGLQNKRSWTQPVGFSAGRLPWKSKIVTCPHCSKEGGETAMKQHHFNHCPRRPK